MSKARCKHCGNIIETIAEHDWVCCSCYREEANTTGIFLEGDGYYFRYGGNLDNVDWVESQGVRHERS